MNRLISHSSSRLLIIAFVAGLIHACGREHAADIQRPEAESARLPVPQTGVADLGQGPVTLFDRACSRCHGPQGAFYGSGFAKLDDDRLRERVEEMMKGPAQLQPSPLQVEAMIAYSRALRDHRPFICVTNAAAFLAGKDLTLRGEVTPGARVSLARGSTTTKARLDQSTWNVPAPPHPPFVLKARSDTAESKIEFPARLWSQ
jgi:hypothetical protein